MAIPLLVTAVPQLVLLRVTSFAAAAPPHPRTHAAQTVAMADGSGLKSAMIGTRKTTTAALLRAPLRPATAALVVLRRGKIPVRQHVETARSSVEKAVTTETPLTVTDAALRVPLKAG